MPKDLFPMPRSEGLVLLILVVFSIFSFLPIWRTTEAFGMALFGWWMAALMVLSPALALFVFLRRP